MKAAGLTSKGSRMPKCSSAVKVRAAGVLSMILIASISGCSSLMPKLQTPEPLVVETKKPIRCDEKLLMPPPLIDISIFMIDSARQWSGIAGYYKARSGLLENMVYELQDCLAKHNATIAGE